MASLMKIMALLLIFPIILIFQIANNPYNSTIGSSIGFQEVAPLLSKIDSVTYEKIKDLSIEKRKLLIDQQSRLEIAQLFISLIASVAVIATAYLTFKHELGHKDRYVKYTKEALPVFTSALLVLQPAISHATISAERRINATSETLTFYVNDILASTGVEEAKMKAIALIDYLNEI